MKPAIIYGQPIEMYGAIKALSASGAWTLAMECPAVFRHTSPWNPDYVEPPRPAFDIGTATHLAVLESLRLAESVQVIDAKDYKTGAARDERDAAYAAGRTPLLWEQMKMVERMAKVLRADRRAAALLDGAEVEVSYYWEDGEVECKARADIVCADKRTLVDLKTLGSASPAFFARQVANLGWDMRAAWYRAGWRLCARTEGPVAYKFLCVGKDEPHVVSVYELQADDLDAAHLINRRAVEVLAECIRRDVWPGYVEDETTVGLPAWARFSRRAAAGLAPEGTQEMRGDW